MHLMQCVLVTSDFNSPSPDDPSEPDELGEMKTEPREAVPLPEIKQEPAHPEAGQHSALTGMWGLPVAIRL